MLTKHELRQVVAENLPIAVDSLNTALQGQQLDRLEGSLTRLGRGGVLPHWFSGLKDNHSLPNLDGKTIGSVVEMLFLAVLENCIFADHDDLSPFSINPARGVDYPDLDLGMKSPSTNFCTSEPFFSAYERLLGSEYDCVVLLTNYQTVKDSPPLKLQILNYKYLRNTELADINLCNIARAKRDFMLEMGDAYAKKFFRFFAYVNQSDWQAKQIINLLNSIENNNGAIRAFEQIETDFAKYNTTLQKNGKEALDDSYLELFSRAKEISPLSIGIIDCADNWVVENLKEAGRLPNDNEWERLKNGPLDGKIGMSFALQWRYNFGNLFNNNQR